VAAGRVLCVATSRASARLLAERIAAVQRAPAAEREQVIEEQLRAATELEPLRALRRRTRPLRGALACVGVVQLLLLFALLPATLYGLLRLSLGPLVLAIGACALLAAALGGALAWRCGARRDLAQELLPLLLFPPSSARVLSHLSRGLLARFDPAALALELLPRPRLVARAREELNRAALGRGAARGSALEA
jgi:hypothetical protein